MNDNLRSNYYLRKNCENVYKNCVLPLIRSDNCVQTIDEIKGVIRHKDKKFLREFNTERAIVYLWVNES
jgi:hypothetical protein